MQRTAILIALCVLPLAGCLGDGDKADTQSLGDGTATSTGTRSASNSTTPSPGATSTTTSTPRPAPGNATGNNTGNATGNATGNSTGNATGNGTGNATWTYENRTGRVSGNAIPVLGTTFSKTETFNATNGTQRLQLNLTTTGSQVTFTVTPPDCKTASCANTTKTSDGKASYATDNVTAGTWTVKLSVTGTVGAVSADYRLQIGQLVAVPANATASP